MPTPTDTPTVDSLEQNRLELAAMLSEMLRHGADETHPRIKALQFAIAALARPAGGSERLREAAAELATAENAYRDSYQYKGPDHIETGRAWDRMRKAGDKLRTALASPQGAEQRQEGPDHFDGCDLEGFIGGCARMGCHPAPTRREIVDYNYNGDPVYATPPPEPAATQGDAIAFRYLKHLSGTTYAWTRWLGIDELHHYGPHGNLVQGPHPDWKVEYAYPALSSPPGVQAAHGGEVSDD